MQKPHMALALVALAAVASPTG